MDAFEGFGADDPNYVGFDYSALLKGAGGLLSGLSGGGGGDKSAEVKQAEEARRRAEQSASNMKMALVAVVGLGAIVFLATRRGGSK